MFPEFFNRDQRDTSDERLMKTYTTTLTVTFPLAYSSLDILFVSPTSFGKAAVTVNLIVCPQGIILSLRDNEKKRAGKTERKRKFPSLSAQTAVHPLELSPGQPGSQPASRFQDVGGHYVVRQPGYVLARHRLRQLRALIDFVSTLLMSNLSLSLFAG